MGTKSNSYAALRLAVRSWLRQSRIISYWACGLIFCTCYNSSFLSSQDFGEILSQTLMSFIAGKLSVSLQNKPLNSDAVGGVPEAAMNDLPFRPLPTTEVVRMVLRTEGGREGRRV